MLTDRVAVCGAKTLVLVPVNDGAGANAIGRGSLGANDVAGANAARIDSVV
ncbi:hypothetical protein [Mesorhizobium sp. AaZ16]|uniref:hypothetical protein n=1 Tax=Mesorhizobium sp. AaZ16 TaxID=3402289 RepID=UPI00374F587C